MSFLLACVGGLVLGRCWSPPRGGGTVRLLPLVYLAAASQVGVGFLPEELRDVVRGPALLLTNLLVGTFLAANARRGRFRLPAAVGLAGWAMNALVVALNAGMPVSLHAVEQVGIVAGDVRDGFLYEHENADDDTVLPWLADIIPVRLGPERSVQSVGDLVLLAGIALAVATGTARREEQPTAVEHREEVST